MASVYLGQRVAPGGFLKTVVLKRLRAELAQKPPLLELFLREASLSAALEHPSIVRTLDLTRIDGDYYLVMEYVSGGDLRLLLRRARRRGQRFSAAAVLYLGRELLSALDYAHTRCTAEGEPLGLSHRDVSPANILLSTQGEVKLSDFGIAQSSAVVGAGGLRLRGKVGYMSPEQAHGGVVDARTDLFALAVVLYEVLTGKRLFIGQPGQPIAEIYDAAIVPPSQLCPNLPADFDAVLAKALAHRPEDRYQSAREFYAALRALTKQHDLWLGRLGLAEHLREICGPDPSTWSSLEERTGTAIIPSIGDFAAAADDSSDELSAPEPAAAAMCDHVITVPWPTVPDKELQPPLSTDDTAPLPAGLPAALLDAATAAATGKPEPETVPALPVESGAGVLSASDPTIGHPRPLGPGVDFDAVTSPAPLMDPTVPLAPAALPELAELAGLAAAAEPPPLTTAQLAASAAPPGSPTRPLPIASGLRQRLRELLPRGARAPGAAGAAGTASAAGVARSPRTRLGLLILGLCGLGAALWFGLAGRWHWLFIHLHGG